MSEGGREIVRRLLLLDRLQVRDQVLQANPAEILVFFDLVKNRAPDGHFARAMGRQERIVAGNKLPNFRDGEFSAIIFRQEGQFGGLRLQRNRDWAVAFAVGTVAGRAVRTEEVRTSDGIN